MKIALDNQISKRTIQYLTENGFDIVQLAGDLPDEFWVSDALSKGARLIVSPDADIPNILDSYNSNCIWVRLPQRYNGKDQHRLVLTLIQKALNRMGYEKIS